MSRGLASGSVTVLTVSYVSPSRSRPPEKSAWMAGAVSRNRLTK